MTMLLDSAILALQYFLLFLYMYVDDIVTAVHSDGVAVVMGSFNSYHQFLQFTYEVEINNSIRFLDLKVVRFDIRMSTD